MLVRTLLGSRRYGRPALAAALAVMVVGAASAAASVSEATRPGAGRMLGPASAHASAAGLSGAGKVLGGFTSQGWPVVLALSGNGKSIALVGIGLDMRCSSGGDFSLEDGVAHAPIGRSGRVREVAVVPPESGTPVSITGGSDSFTGQFDRRHERFSGVWQLHVDFKSQDGTSDHCDSGRVRFSARR